MPPQCQPSALLTSLLRDTNIQIRFIDFAESRTPNRDAFLRKRWSPQSALADSSDLDSSYIFVTARGSDITLAGWVHVQAEVLRAEEITLRTKGVHKVHNELSPDL
ncbi:BON domain-containing protein [Rhizobium sp. NLR22b]|uniref:BON domain-containing protein n=1 Tax=Rhizobium sp. NLR22b TaxID=2731115 RepID=UPI002180A69E|nr:BON domain-containing protein [Rhizobium sp. NLR22b]